MANLVLEVGLALAMIAGAALLSARLRFSVVPFLILAGMIVGPHAPKIGPFDFRFIDSAPLIAFMGRMGILFLLFYLGLEFSVTRLIKAGRSIAIGGSIYIGINFTAGLVYGFLMGWPIKEGPGSRRYYYHLVQCDCRQGAVRPETDCEPGNRTDPRDHHVRRRIPCGLSLACFRQSFSVAQPLFGVF